jgi:hypothetical protein
MKKLIITGHTSSIGKLLFDYYQTKYDVIGISRSTGYDLNDSDDLNRIIKLSLEAKHFINLANVGKSQTELLYYIHKLGSEVGRTGRIINFGTLATEVSFDLLKKIPVDMEMLAHKLSLEKLHKELSVRTPFGKQPESVLIRFANYGKKLEHRANEPFTSPDQMTKIIDFILESDTYISSIDFREV